MLKKAAIVFFSAFSMLFLSSSLPVVAKQSEFFKLERLLDLIQVPIATSERIEDERIEFVVVTDQDEIREELKRIGVDYDQAIDQLYDEGVSQLEWEGTQGAGGHAGAMWCSSPNKANDLFLVSPGPYAVGFFSGSVANPVQIGGCAGAST